MMNVLTYSPSTLTATIITSLMPFRRLKRGLSLSNTMPDFTHRRIGFNHIAQITAGKEGWVTAVRLWHGQICSVRKGYSLVGCGIAGVNAFFMRDDLVGEHFA